MGLWMVEQQLLPDRIISSPAKRAIASAYKVCDAIGYAYGRIDQDERLYEASLDGLLDILHEQDETEHRLLLVGHNPGLEHLLIHLCSDIEIPDDGKLLPTAALAQLSLDGSWSELNFDGARLVSITRARSLPEYFPFRGEYGIEYRERPEHFYFQSGVIPYRRNNSRLEILLVSSRKNKWILPKGIIEKNMSARASAQQEAFEEAGIKGQLEEQPLVAGEYNKWGGPCQLQLFAMKVEQLVDAPQWAEAWRQRRWFDAEQAINHIADADIRKLLRQSLNQLT
jgi:phosphohistidine phosphatase